MCRSSFDPDHLGYEAVTAVAADPYTVQRNVMGQCHIHIIESTDADQFTFSTTVSDLAISDQLILEFDLTVLFRRCGEEDHLSIQLLCHLCIRKCQRRSDDSCQLCVMSTAVSCLCLLICMCMLRNPQGIQFPINARDAFPAFSLFK